VFVQSCLQLCDLLIGGSPERGFELLVAGIRRQELQAFLFGCQRQVLPSLGHVTVGEAVLRIG
jgi:hypothetical protein